MWISPWTLVASFLCVYNSWDLLTADQHSACKKYISSSEITKYKLNLTQMRNDVYSSLFPLSVNISLLVEELKSNVMPSLPPVYDYNNYKYMSDCKHICESDFKVLFVVKTGCGNFERRKTVRETWGKESADHRIVFVLGSNPKYKSEILEENKVHQDIVQFDFEDNYLNLTLKDMLAFKWVLEYCSQIKHIALVDDDVLVTVKNVIKYFDTNKRVKEGKLYGGRIEFTPYPYRVKMSKNYISYEEYPFDKYPNYATGVCSFFTSDMIRDMYYASFYTKHIRADDVYLGVLSKKLNVKPFHMGYDIIFPFGLRTRNDTDVLCEVPDTESRMSLGNILKN